MKKVWTDNVLKGSFFIFQQICLIWKNNITFITANMGVDVDLGEETCGAGVGKHDVGHAHQGHGPGEGVDLPIRHHRPGEALGDPVDGEEQDEETLRSKKIRTLAQRPAAVKMENKVGVRVTNNKRKQ